VDSPSPRPWLERIELIAGSPCLDFINSMSDHGGPTPTERLTSYGELVFWTRRCGLLTEAEAERFAALGQKHPRTAAAALKAALAFREAAFRMLQALAAGSEPAAADLAVVNLVVNEAQAGLELVPVAGHYHLDWRAGDASPQQLLWRVARALAELMTSDQLLTVRVCAGESCGWLFLDQSRNHLRRWCSMSDCGNRAKAREFYKRRRPG